MSTVLFLMDAMRSDYIDSKITPFLWQCSRDGEYYKRVIPNFGFCERTEIFTGQTPAESGFFTAIGRDEENSPFKDLPELPLLEFFDNSIPKNFTIPLILKKGELYQFFRKIINRWIIKRTKGISPQNIPVGLLPYWALTEDLVDHREENAFKVNSIFSLLKKSGKKLYYDSFTALNIPFNGSDKNRIEMMLKNYKKNNTDLSLVYISTPDQYGHEYGPGSTELNNALSKMDSQLEYYTHEVLKIDEKAKFIFLGDHGMSEVNKYFDAEKQILKIAKLNKLKLKKDFIYFLDSTVVRLWLNSKKAKMAFEEELLCSDLFIKNGTFIDEKIALNEKIPWKDSRYGDIIWWANNGTLVFPDFFHRIKKYKGMHGYNPQKIENQGTCIVFGEKINKNEVVSIYLTDVFDILKNTLSLNEERN